jgi:SAM-dependent methyltransferase
MVPNDRGSARYYSPLLALPGSPRPRDSRVQQARSGANGRLSSASRRVTEAAVHVGNCKRAAAAITVAGRPALSHIPRCKGPYVPQPDLRGLYDAHYYRTYAQGLGGEGLGDDTWQTLAAAMATGMITELNPTTLLDAGCGRGFLVAALRDRGVQAFGFDSSPYAIEHVREDIKPFCWEGSITDSLPQRYDTILCLEVVEHLPPADARRAIEVLCAATDDIVFSSTPTDFRETTHINVRPPEYWAGLFAQQEFFRDVDCDPIALGFSTFTRFRKRTEPLHRIVTDYERRLWTLLQENVALRLAALEAKVAFSRQDEALRAATSNTSPDIEALELTIVEQHRHLDALNERVAFMSDHEKTLRSLMLDAHQQLLERDQAMQPLRDEVERQAELRRSELEHRDRVIEAIEADSAARLALIHRLTAEAEQHRAAVAEADASVATLTALVEQLNTELKQRHADTEELRRLMMEHASWAERRVAEAEQRAGVGRQAVPPAAAPSTAPAAAALAAPQPSLVGRVGAAVRRQRGVWRIERRYRKLRRRLQG